MIYTKISQYVIARSRYNQIPAKITKEGIKFFINGYWTSDKPICPEFTKAKQNNPDGTYVK